VTEHSDKLDAAEKEKIESAITELETSLNNGSVDRAEIDATISALSTASQKLGEKLYADAQAQQAATTAAQQAGTSAPDGEDNVVEADFKEVKK
jgi:molecular chaperone DnaK